MQRFYDPATFKPATFFDAVARFRAGDDDPRRYLERCLEVIAAREPTVKAWVVLNEQAARDCADASSMRWRRGQPLSLIDGMPVGIKDLIETKDMPTQMGCAAFEGNFPKRDSALVRALREAGAIILGKTVTSELGGAHPGPTLNPFDPRRTPGGSSSGSAAAVGAAMVPVAIGTQVGGSVIRPASFCANWALKPTYGALNRGERLGYSHSHIGVHAGSPIDMWRVAMEIALRAGGDPGHPGLFGPREEAPAPFKPGRLAVLETAGWDGLDGVTREAFAQVLESLRKLDVEVIRRADSPLVEAFERSISTAREVTVDICDFEFRWSLENIAEQHPGGLSPTSEKRLERARGLSLDDYRRRLAQRDEARHRLEALRPTCDALIGLSSKGPAPRGADRPVGSAPPPTGDSTFNIPSSMLGAPAVSVPLLSIDWMPVGIQILGQPQCDERVVGIARWLAGAVAPVAVTSTALETENAG